MRKKGRTIQLSPAAALLKYTAVGVAVGLVCCIVFSLLAAVVLSVSDLPHRSIMPISMAIIGVSMLIGAFIAGRLLHRRGLLLGALVGVAAFAVIFLAGMFVPDENIGITLTIKAALCIIPSIVGAVIGVNVRAKY